MKAKYTSETTKAEIVAKYQSGESLKDLASFYGLTGTTIVKYLNAASVPTREIRSGSRAEKAKRNEQIKADFLAGLTTTEIMEKRGLSRDVVNDVTQKLRSAQQKERNDNIIADFQQGMSISAISRKYNIVHVGIRYILDQNNIERKRFPYLTISHNKLIQETPELMYWIGMALADGSMHFEHESYPRFTLSLKKSDVEIIQKLRDFIEADRCTIKFEKVSNHQIMGKEVKREGQAILSFSSPNLNVWVDKYGVVPNKTYNFKTPEIPDELFGHCLRGWIDGDGHISITPKNNCYTVGITGNLDALSWLKQKLESFNYPGTICYRKRNEIYGVISMQGKDNIGWLYNFCDASNPLRLDRKWSKLDTYYK